MILIGLSLVWGSSFILIKKSLVVFDPIEVGAMRIAISGICFAPLFLFRLKKVDRKRWFYFMVVAIAGSGIPAFLYPVAQTHIDSAVAGILNALTPLFTLILGVILFRKVFRVHYLFGLVTGFLGVILLSINDITAEGSIAIFYYFLIILATMCYAISVNTVDSFFKDMDSITLSAGSFVIVGPIGVAYLLGTDIYTDVTSHPDGYAALLYVFLLAFFGTFLAIMIFFQLVQRTNAVFGSLVAYLIPIVALGWGIVFGESLGVLEFTGMACILLGVYLSRNY
jgi:drug/metabolite transporter (DMT)-like permease